MTPLARNSESVAVDAAGDDGGGGGGGRDAR